MNPRTARSMPRRRSFLWLRGRATEPSGGSELRELWWRQKGALEAAGRKPRSSNACARCAPPPAGLRAGQEGRPEGCPSASLAATRGRVEVVRGDVAQGRLGSVRVTVGPAHLRRLSNPNDRDAIPGSRAEGEPQRRTATGQQRPPPGRSAPGRPLEQG